MPPKAPKASLLQTDLEVEAESKDENDELYNDWTGDKWVKYAGKYGVEPYPAPHDPDWYKKNTFWESVYQPVAPASLV